MKIKNDFIWHKEENKDLDFSKIEEIGGFADLEGCSSDLSSLESIGGWAYLQGCSEELKKSLAKTLKKCGNIYIEFEDEPLTLKEFKRRYSDEVEEMTVEEICKELGREVKIIKSK